MRTEYVGLINSLNREQLKLLLKFLYIIQAIVISRLEVIEQVPPPF